MLSAQQVSWSKLLAAAERTTVVVGGVTVSVADVLLAVGALYVGGALLSAIGGVVGGVQAALVPRKALRKYGQWAVVTGATDVRAGRGAGDGVAPRYVWPG
jgi:hypothetical protein